MPQSLPFQQFQALLHSPFEVLCIFPSQYLFAIDLSLVFSLWGNAPPNFGLYSQTIRLLDMGTVDRLSDPILRDYHPFSCNVSIDFMEPVYLAPIPYATIRPDRSGRF